MLLAFHSSISLLKNTQNFPKFSFTKRACYFFSGRPSFLSSTQASSASSDRTSHIDFQWKKACSLKNGSISSKTKMQLFASYPKEICSVKNWLFTLVPLAIPSECLIPMICIKSENDNEYFSETFQLNNTWSFTLLFSLACCTGGTRRPSLPLVITIGKIFDDLNEQDQ